MRLFSLYRGGNYLQEAVGVMVIRSGVVIFSHLSVIRRRHSSGSVERSYVIELTHRPD